jgi:hypothetical protein
VSIKVIGILIYIELRDNRPIVTYQGLGVAKPGIIINHHTIAFTSRSEPKLENNEERACLSSGPMLQAIRVRPKHKGNELRPMSRIDFGRIYTVDHTVKVYDFGKVHENYLERFFNQWIHVIKSLITSSINDGEFVEQTPTENRNGST